MGRTVLVSFLFAFSVLLSSGARAQIETGADIEARTLYERGRAAYEGGEFAEASRLLRRAYVVSPRYGLLYNIGQAELRAGHDAQALESFEGYLRQAPPEDEHRSEVAERVRVLRSLGIVPSSEVVRDEGASATTTQHTETMAETTAEPSASTSSTSSTGDSSGVGPAPWIVLGVGAAVAVAGAVLVGVGVSEAGRVTGADGSLTWPELRDIASGADVLFGTGLALLGVGVAASAVGIAWGLAAGGSENRASADVSLRISPVRLSLEARF